VDELTAILGRWQIPQIIRLAEIHGRLGGERAQPPWLPCCSSRTTHVLPGVLTWTKETLMKILVTGFNPFDGEPINPSWEAVRRLPDTVERAEIIKVQIPTSFGRSADVVRAAILEHDPDVVVSVGQAGGEFAMTPERIAINIDDGRIPAIDLRQARRERPDGQRAHAVASLFAD
jgi:hypothetical protein